jgi:hypothetical protein
MCVSTNNCHVQYWAHDIIYVAVLNLFVLVIHKGVMVLALLLAKHQRLRCFLLTRWVPWSAYVLGVDDCIFSCLKLLLYSPYNFFLLYVQLHAFIEYGTVEDAEKAVWHLSYPVMLFFFFITYYKKEWSVLFIGCWVQRREQLEKWD